MSRITVEIEDANPREKQILCGLIRQDRALEPYSGKPVTKGEGKGKEVIQKSGPDVILKGTLADKISGLNIRLRLGGQGGLAYDPGSIFERDILELFQDIGIPANVKGHVYLKEAIILSISNTQMRNSITKKLYPSVAEKYGTTPSRVERAIRHAIENAWERGELKAAEEICGLTVNSRKGRPTNTELILSIAEYIRVLHGPGQ